MTFTKLLKNVLWFFSGGGTYQVGDLRYQGRLPFCSVLGQFVPEPNRLTNQTPYPLHPFTYDDLKFKNPEIPLVNMGNIKRYDNPRKNNCLKLVSSFVNKVLTFHGGN